MLNDPLQEVVDYLVAKVAKVNINNPRANKGAQYLRAITGYQIALREISNVTFSKLSMNFTREYPEQPIGVAKATQIVTNVGEHVFAKYFNQKADFQQTVHVGAAILEGFTQVGFIRVYRAEGFSNYNDKAPFVIEPTERWEEIAEFKLVEAKDDLMYSVDTKPEDITGLMQEKGYPLIKRWGFAAPKEQQDMFNDMFVDSPFVRAINKLQQTAWIINPKVLEVVLKNIDDVLPEHLVEYEHAIPKSKLKEAYDDYKNDPNAKTKARYNRVAKEWEKTLRPIQARAKRAEVKTTLGKAKILAGWEQFYQLADKDYRGRSYYREPYMNYQGNDLARGLMKFKESKPLTDEGKRALAIHTANSFNQKYTIAELHDIDWLEEDYISILKADQVDTISVDKFSLEDRINWFNEHWELIEDTADNGIIQDKAEKPIVFLACCMEWIAIASMIDAGITPVTNIPVAIDGTCNGYQHSAAMSRDEKTGRLVALEDNTIPYDLYIKVAQRLTQIAPDFFAKRNMTYSEIRKLISKRATMTRAYSAGSQTIADAMYSDCVQAGADVKHNITQIDCDELADDILEAIREECPGSQKVMKFLQRLAMWELGTFEWFDSEGNKVSKTKYGKWRKEAGALNKKVKKDPTPELQEQLNDLNKKIADCEFVLTSGYDGEDIRWVTPSGFPVIYQIYSTQPVSCLATLKGAEGGQVNQKGRINFAGQVYTDRPNRQEACAGIAPNYIHSQDASHMDIVIEAFDGDFGAVNDSFSCHASDVPLLKQLTQEAFVDMYNDENPLETIKQRIIGINADDCNVEVPTLGGLDITAVEGSRNFFA